MRLRNKKQRNEEKYLDNIIINSSDAKQRSIIIKDTDVRPNDHKVLELLAEHRSSYSFRGLMRKLGLHQESLSRSLDRLDQLGLVEKSHLGYKLSRKGEFLAKANVVAKPRIAYVPLVQTYVPANVDVGKIVGDLAGRWFKNLRWLGMVLSEGGYMLQWTSEYGSFRLNLRIVRKYIIIETDANSDEDKVKAMHCAYRIFERLTKLYSANYKDLSSSYTLSNDKLAN